MRMAALMACAAVAVGWIALVAITASCGDKCRVGAMCDAGGTFNIASVACIASIQTDCAGSVLVPCKGDGGFGAASGSYGAAYALPDGGACTVTTVLEDGTTISLPVHWVLRAPANECCPASYAADPPTLEIGKSNIDASTD